MTEDLRIRLLVVDDEQSIRRLCMTVGEALGFVCMEAESGEAALALLEEQPCPRDPHRHGDAQHVRTGVSGEGEEIIAAHRGCRHDWPWLGRDRRTGNEIGRVRLHQQTVFAIGRIAAFSAPHGGQDPAGGREPIFARTCRLRKLNCMGLSGLRRKSRTFCA